jgi:hypothetical protein
MARLFSRFAWVALLAALVAIATASAPAWTSASAPNRPTTAQINKVLSEAVEVAPGEPANCKGKTCERLHRLDTVVIVTDGHGGWLTAVPAERWPTADGYGQLVLFWHDRGFVGSETLAHLPSLGPEAVSLAIVGSGPDRIVIRFARYRPSDAMCCPSLKPMTIVYTWTGKDLKASAQVPSSALLPNLDFVL